MLEDGKKYESPKVLEDRPCIFCGIVAGELPAGQIFETSRLVVITAQEDGYPIILTKQHINDLRDPNLDPETAGELGVMQRDMARLVSLVDQNDISVFINNGSNAGQEISHLHIHIMPRVPGDKRVRISRGTILSVDERQSRAALYKQYLQKLQTP